MAQLDNFFRRGRVVCRAATTHHTLIGQSIASIVRFGSKADLVAPKLPFPAKSAHTAQVEQRPELTRTKGVGLENWLGL